MITLKMAVLCTPPRLVEHADQIGPSTRAPHRGQEADAERITDQPTAEMAGQRDQRTGKRPSPICATLDATRVSSAAKLNTTPLGSPVFPEVNRTSVGWRG